MLASVCLDTGTVTGGPGLDVVTEVVDTATTDDKLLKTPMVTVAVEEICKTAR